MFESKITTQSFQSQVKKTLIGDQGIQPEIVWLGIMDNSQYLCIQILQNLIDPNQKQLNIQFHERMYSTLLLVLFSVSKTKKTIQQKIKDLLISKKKFCYGHRGWVLKYYAEDEQRKIFQHHFVSRLCLAPYDFDRLIFQPFQQFKTMFKQEKQSKRMLRVQNQEKKYKELKYQCFPQCLQQTKILAYSYICFQMKTQYSGYQRSFIEHVIKVLQKLIHCYRKSLSVQCLLNSLLHLIQNMVKINGILFKDLILQLAKRVNNLRTFPGKIGGVADETFSILHSELKSLGQNFRKKLRKDFPNLDIKGSQYLSKQYYLISRTPTFFVEKSNLHVTSVRKLIIYHLLSTSKITEKQEYFENQIMNMDKQTTYKVYYKMLDIVKISMTLDTYEKIQALQNKYFTELFNKVKKAEQMPDQKNDELMNCLNQKIFNTGYFVYPKFQLKEISLTNMIGIKGQKFYSLYKTYIQKPDHSNQLDFFQSPVPIVFFGNGQQFHYLIQDYCANMEKAHPKETLKFKFYILPKKQENFSLAKYLSFKDLWYNRFIYNVFHESMLIPQPPLRQQLSQSLPFDFWKESLQMFLRQAERIFPVQTYLCQIKTANSSSLQRIYFYSHVLIGVSADCEAIRIANEKNVSFAKLDYVDILLDKVKRNCSFVADMKITYKQPNITGEKYITSQQKKLPIEDLMICNLPRQYFMGNKPNPNSLQIQMALLPENYGKIFKRQLTNFENFVSHNREEYVQAFKDLFIRQSIVNIEISDLKVGQSGARISIDGRIIQDVTYLSISPAFSENKYPIKLPIRCFLLFEDTIERQK